MVVTVVSRFSRTERVRLKADATTERVRLKADATERARATEAWRLTP